jgi:hypothetical protein
MTPQDADPREGELWSINRRAYIGRTWFDPGAPILVIGCERPEPPRRDGDRVRILRAIIGGQQHEMYVSLDLLDRLA